MSLYFPLTAQNYTRLLRTKSHYVQWGLLSNMCAKDYSTNISNLQDEFNFITKHDNTLDVLT